MTNTSTDRDRKAIFILSSAAGIIGGLCCLTPIVLVLFGLASVSAAASLGNMLYGDYRWLFRILALIFVGIGLAVYFRRLGICTLDAVKRERNRLINVSLLALLVTLGAYIFWTYVVLHYWGIAAGLPWAQYDESWAIPSAAVVFAVAAVVSFAIRRAKRKQPDHLRPHAEFAWPAMRNATEASPALQEGSRNVFAEERTAAREAAGPGTVQRSGAS